MKNQQLWKKAKTLIPGGVQLFSKLPDRFLPGGWPTYYTKAKGCYVWDLEGKKYLDMTYMGIGACILGYADNDVDSAVKRAIDKGSMSTLNCPEEVDLALILTSLHPWADMVRYARTGGEATTIAIRIARTYTGKEKVVFCGYHGWHDWYGAGGILEVAGIPKCLKKITSSFHFNHFEEIPQTNDIAAIIMEVEREHPPEKGFLENVRKLATKIGAVLIFDEITSGFRCNIGGIHLLYGVNPDMCVFGKALGNGYPISAIIGKRKIMMAATKTYISSTFWTERVGPTAAIATIKKLKDKSVPDHLCDMGYVLKTQWAKWGLETHNPLPLVGFSLKNDREQTKFNQEMLKRGILATNCVYLSYAHKPEHIDKYLKTMDEVLKILPKVKLEYPVIRKGFKRLT